MDQHANKHKEKCGPLAELFKMLETAIDGIEPSRYKYIALDKIQEAQMWLNFSMDLEQSQRESTRKQE